MSGTRLKVATRPATVGTTWLDLFHPGTPSELTLEARVRVVADIAGALIQIHENPGAPRPHRRHGRLTPRHVLVSVDGSASLFNVREPFSKLLPPQPDLGYLAPELLTQSGPATQQGDVFSLGVLLWEALDNGRLFPHRRAESIHRLIARRSLPAPRATEEWALPLCDACLRALSPEPSERPVDATAFWLALREHLPPPDSARSLLSRLVQRALKLELSSDVPEPPSFDPPSAWPRSQQPGVGWTSHSEPAEAPARYSLHPEPRTPRFGASARPAASGNPAWLLSDSPAKPPESEVRNTSAGPAPSHSASPSAVGRQPAPPLDSPRRSIPTNTIPAVSTLRVNLQRELADGKLPFLLTPPPARRPLPWGAIGIAAVLFFGVGAAVAFGAVAALRASGMEGTHESAPVSNLPAPSSAVTRVPNGTSPAASAPAAPAPPIAEAARAADYVDSDGEDSDQQRPRTEATDTPHRAVRHLTKPAKRIRHVPAPVQAADAPAADPQSAEPPPDKATAEPPIEPESEDALPFVKEPY
jgi:hypothetical protein